MNLAEFEYWERIDADDEWRVERLHFGRFNLIVGRNATGKTRLLKSIARVSGELSGESKPTDRETKFDLVTSPAERRASTGDSKREWAANAQYLSFAAKMNLKLHPAGQSFSRIEIAQAFRLGIEQFSATFEAEVLKALAEVGCGIQSVHTTGDARGELRIMEAHRSAPTPFRRLSQAQQRAFTLMTFLVFLRRTDVPATVLIDDFAEGLDFEHARRLTELVRRLSADSQLQFIVASNDRYVMNAVPLEEWTILVENGSTTRVINYTNSKQKFDDFKFTGLNNFDFFSMDFAQPEA